MSCGYTAVTNGKVTCAAATAKTILAVTSPASHGLVLCTAKIGLAGTTSSAEPVLVELISFTQGTGTSTAQTLQQIRGRAVAAAASFEGRRNFTAEPTGVAVLDEWSITPFGGLAMVPLPLAREFDTGVSSGLGLRVTAPANVDARASLEVERI